MSGTFAIDFLYHGPNFSFTWVLSQVLHDQADLIDCNGAVAISIEDFKGFSKL